MFACIYFTEDSSLSVVGRADKNLCVLHEWKPREQVEMKWGKKLFHGTIIQIGAPQPKVIELFQLLLHPTVRQYMTKMVEQFPLFGSENRDSPNPHYTDLDTDSQLMIPNSQHFNSVPFGSYPSSSCAQLFQSQQSITTQESNIRNHFQQYTPMPAGQN